MRSLIFISLAILAMSCVLLCTGTVDISRESGMEILANLTNISQNQSQNATLDNTTAANASLSSEASGTGTSGTGTSSAQSLWSWGNIPVGYTLDENGTLKRDASTEWKPSI
ncbi:MAG TPA: hypothetical protein PKK68_02325 [Methanothrix soehngenii]|nr:hypothetical protein [Methanothrix soehngenii]